MNQQFLFYDIDGTIYLLWLGLTERVKKALLSARERGHKLFLCTGRSLVGIPSEVLSVGFDGMICSGGSAIQLGKEVVYQQSIVSNDLYALMDVLERLEIAYELETSQGTYYSEEMIRLCRKYEGDISGNSEMARLTNGKDLSLMRMISDFRAAPIDVPKVAFLSESPALVDELKAQVPESLRTIVFGVTKDGATNGEIVPKDVDKGAAIRRLCQLTDHDIKDTIGFGDSFNDLEMLQTCAQAVVMTEADAAIREHATLICPSIQEDGVYTAMMELGLCDTIA